MQEKLENELVFSIIAINCSGTTIIINYNFHHVYLRTGPDFTSSFSKIRPFKMYLGIASKRMLSIYTQALYHQIHKKGCNGIFFLIVGTYSEKKNVLE